MATNIMRRNNGGSSTPATNTWVDQLFQQNLKNFFQDDFWGFSGVNQQNSVPVNVKETTKTYEMELIAPGLKKEDFKLNVSNDQLTVSFEQKEESNQENKEEGWLRKEYRAQSFSRSFHLDETVDVNKIAASYNNGILQVSLPKKENAQKISRTIDIK